jgi:hypothetical protein
MKPNINKSKRQSCTKTSTCKTNMPKIYFRPCLHLQGTMDSINFVDVFRIIYQCKNLDLDNKYYTKYHIVQQ